MSTYDQTGKVQTVLGPIEPGELGTTLTHEHLLIDLSFLRPEPAEAHSRRIFHAPLTLVALDADLDVICEKPMAETLADAAAMNFRARERERMVMVHHQLRWHPSRAEPSKRGSARTYPAAPCPALRIAAQRADCDPVQCRHRPQPVPCGHWRPS